MKCKSEVKLTEPKNNNQPRKSRTQNVVTEKEDIKNKAWDLSCKLKARMDALHGAGSKSKVVAKRKKNFKKMTKLGESDSTPSEFDPHDSDYDKSSSEESDDSSEMSSD